MNFDDTYDPESWEGYYELYENEDWIGLLKLSEIEAKRHPSDLNAQQRYAEALNLNKKYKETLDFITPLYEKNSDVGFGIKEIVDALYGLGKTEENFNWIQKPIILKLNPDTVEFCANLLKNRKRSVRIIDLYGDLLMEADYCIFEEIEFAEFIVKFTDVFEIKLEKDFMTRSKLKIKSK